MKPLIFVCYFVFSFNVLLAQKKTCYTQNLNSGKALLNAGRYNDALSDFEVAKECPDVNIDELTLWINKAQQKLKGRKNNSMHKTVYKAANSKKEDQAKSSANELESKLTGNDLSVSSYTDPKKNFDRLNDEISTSEIITKNPILNIDNYQVTYEINNNEIRFDMTSKNYPSIKVDINQNSVVDSNFDKTYSPGGDNLDICVQYLFGSNGVTSYCGVPESKARVSKSNNTYTFVIPLRELMSNPNTTTVSVAFDFTDLSNYMHFFFPKRTFLPEKKNYVDFSKVYKIQIPTTAGTNNSKSVKQAEEEKTHDAYNTTLGDKRKEQLQIVEQLLKETGFELKFIPGGTFDMGSNKGKEDNKPIHKVTIDSFYISKFVVTQLQWKSLMGRKHDRFNHCDKCGTYGVSWNEAQEFIKQLNKKTHKSFRLPTEAEWEYAARGGEEYDYAGTNNFFELNPSPYYAGEMRVEVDSTKPNGYGLYGMSYYLQEWCSDYYDDKYYSNSPSLNPRNDFSHYLTPFHVLRGGITWRNHVHEVYSRDNSQIFGDDYNRNQTGLRLILSQ